MKKKKYKSRIRKVRSFDELKLAKARLREEVLKTNNEIRSDYRHLLNEFSLGRIVGNIAEQLSTKTSVLSRAFSAGKKIITRIHEKRKNKIRNS